jgi:putative acetyltransferase
LLKSKADSLSGKKMEIRLSSFEIDSYDEVYGLWRQCEGIGLSDADTRESIEAYLKRNRDMSLIATSENRTVGAVLCGHDGRRGYLHHLAVHPDYRRQGIGRRLVDECLSRLSNSGIKKCHLFIFNDNYEGIRFWDNAGWTHRIDISIISKNI